MATQTPQTPTDEFNKFKEIFRESIFIFECEKVICYNDKECKGIDWHWANAVEDIFSIFTDEPYLRTIKISYNKVTNNVEFTFYIPGILVSANSVPELVTKLIEKRYELLGSLLSTMFSDGNWGLKLTDKEIIDLLIDLSSVTFTKKYDLDDILAKLQKLHELYRWKSQLLCQ